MDAQPKYKGGRNPGKDKTTRHRKIETGEDEELLKDREMTSFVC
jgi:hypothetical protein